MSSVLILLATLVPIVFIYFYEPPGLSEISNRFLQFQKPFAPTKNTGAILITNAATGQARDLALALASSGLHVIAGVGSEAEARSFLYENQKGVEPILLDENDPASVAKVLYRIRQIRRELGRQFVGVVINNQVTVHAMSKRAPRSDPNNSNGPAPHELVNVKTLDEVYRTLIKTSMRLVEASVSVIRSAENSGGDPAQFYPREKHNPGRVIFLESSDFLVSYKNCGVICIAQEAVASLADYLRRDLRQYNISVSRVVIGSSSKNQLGSSSSYSYGIKRNKRTKNNKNDKFAASVLYKWTQWAIDSSPSKANDNNARIGNHVVDPFYLNKLDSSTLNILKALYSTFPQAVYYPRYRPIFDRFLNSVVWYFGYELDEEDHDTTGRGGGKGSGSNFYASEEFVSKVFNPVRTALKRHLLPLILTGGNAESKNEADSKSMETNDGQCKPNNKNDEQTCKDDHQLSKLEYFEIPLSAPFLKRVLSVLPHWAIDKLLVDFNVVVKL